MSILGGVCLGGALVLGREYLDRSVHDRARPEGRIRSAGSGRDHPYSARRKAGEPNEPNSAHPRQGRARGRPSSHPAAGPTPAAPGGTGRSTAPDRTRCARARVRETRRSTRRSQAGSAIQRLVDPRTVLDPYLIAAPAGNRHRRRAVPRAADTHRATRVRRSRPHRARHQPRTRRRQEPDGRESRPDDGRRTISAASASWTPTFARRSSTGCSAWPETPGLSDVLLGRTPLEEALVTIEDLRLTVLPAGPPPDHPGRTSRDDRRCDGRSTRCGLASTASSSTRRRRRRWPTSAC